MKKKFAYAALIGFFIAATAFVIVRYDVKNKNAVYYPLLERKGPQATMAEWASLQQTGEGLMRQARDNKSDIKSRIALATLYIQEGRVTGNHGYYEKAAMTYIDEVLVQEPSHFEALTLKALILLSQHHFAEALVLAQSIQKSNPYNAFVYGLLVDAYVELGQYNEAVKSAEQMMSIRPDIRSYSRVAYLREIHGDIDGAIEAMKLAIDAGGNGDEATAWARIQLAKLYEQKGDAKAAEMHCTIALDQRPGYAYALAGLANIAAHKNDFSKAIKLFEEADGLVNDVSFKEQLFAVYSLNGNGEKAKEVLKNAIEQMEKDADETNAESAGHHADKELAWAYAVQGNYNKALNHAMIAYKQRPKNIEVNETVAWILYKQGKSNEAVPYITEALKTRSKNPSLLCRAGLIFYKAGDKEKARQLLQEGLQNDAMMESQLKKEAAELSKIS